MLGAVFALLLGLRPAAPQSMAPSLSADLDGDGTAEAVTAEPGRGAVSLKVQGGASKRTLTAKAPAPAEDVVRVSLTSAPLGAVGALLEVSAATDQSECLSVWRYKGGSLDRLPIRGAGGRVLPDCAKAGEWKHRWERPVPDAPSVLVRERVSRVERGTLRRRETYAFAGFSLDLDRARSATDVGGIPIPDWYEARFYTQEGLERLYARFDLPSFRSTPRLSIEADRDKGVFNLRFTTPTEDIVAPVESFSVLPAERTASLTARAGERAVQASITLGGDGRVPVEIRIQGMGHELDSLYGPAGAWHGRSREVFATAADEMASEHLNGVWGTPRGGTVRMQFDGDPPYRLRMDQAVYAIDFDHPAKAADLTLVPTDGSRRGWGLVLEGPNAVDRFPLTCEAGRDGSACQADGDSERLRRMGARINVN